MYGFTIDIEMMLSVPVIVYEFIFKHSAHAILHIWFTDL